MSGHYWNDIFNQVLPTAAYILKKKKTNGGKNTWKTVDPVCPLSLLDHRGFSPRANKSLNVEYSLFQQTNHDVVLENTLRESVEVVVGSTVESAALASKALCVNDASPGLSGDHIMPGHPKQSQCHSRYGHILHSIENLPAHSLSALLSSAWISGIFMAVQLLVQLWLVDSGGLMIQISSCSRQKHKDSQPCSIKATCNRVTPNGGHQNSMQATTGKISCLQNNLSWMKNDIKINSRLTVKKFLETERLIRAHWNPFGLGIQVTYVGVQCYPCLIPCNGNPQTTFTSD